jgi:hypothetical protein
MQLYRSRPESVVEISGQLKVATKSTVKRFWGKPQHVYNETTQRVDIARGVLITSRTLVVDAAHRAGQSVVPYETHYSLLATSRGCDLVVECQMFDRGQWYFVESKVVPLAEHRREIAFLHGGVRWEHPRVGSDNSHPLFVVYRHKRFERNGFSNGVEALVSSLLNHLESRASDHWWPDRVGFVEAFTSDELQTKYGETPGFDLIPIEP